MSAHEPSLTLSGSEILQLPTDAPGYLFSDDLGLAQLEFRQLAKRWHPDGNRTAEAERVFQHIEALYRQARAQIAAGIWRAPGVLRFSSREGQRYEVAYVKHHAFELGDMYLSPAAVTYVLAQEYADLYANALQRIANLPYAHADMRAQMEPLLPSIAAQFSTADALVLIVRKTPEQVLLRDLLTHAGRIEPVHAAWMLSGLLNLACYLDYAGLTHNALALDTCFVSPASHQVSLLGGWWYACPVGQKMLALPERSLALLAPDALHHKLASHRLDLELIRELGRELLGLKGGGLPAADLPAALAQWLRLASSGTALHDYQHWQRHVLRDSFGPRRFVRLAVSADDIYPQ